MGIIRQANRVLMILPIIVLLAFSPSDAADRMYFGGIATKNKDTVAMDVVLVWGELEGTIPPQIVSFRIYRKSGGGAFSQIADVDNRLLSSGQMRALVF